MLRILTILFLSNLVSCKDGKVSNETTVEKTDLEINAIDTVQKTKSQLPEPVNVIAIKNLTWLTTTSGVLGDTESQKQCIQHDSIGFYGFYSLIDMAIGRPIGTLKIHTTDDPENWRFDSKNEQFAEINLTTNKIAVWDSIRVGLSEEKLLDFIGNRFHSKKGNMIYAELDAYEGKFLIENDTINELSIKNNCN